jgi:hypothetical protein
MFTWTAENLAYAVEQWAQGATSTMIAAAIGTTRNSVIGKLRRIGALPAHRITLPVAEVSTVAEAPEIAPTDIPVVPKPPRRARVSKPKTLLKLRFATEHRTADCRWPLGDWAYGTDLRHDPPTVLFCGAPAEAGKSWCTAHCQQAFQRRR